jgi:hypothetical protein
MAVKAARTAQPVNTTAKPNDGMQTCRYCGGDIFYSIHGAGGGVSGWIHDASYLNSCPKK